MPIDEVALRIDQTGQLVLGLIIAFIMYGVALELRLADFVAVLRRPLPPVSGVLMQALGLPAATLLLTLVLDPRPSVAFGMIVVAACPSGNLSNLMTYLARGNVALSVSMTALSSVLAVVTTPLNILFWASLNPKTAALLREVAVDPAVFLGQTAVQLGLPLLLGMLTVRFFPNAARRMQRPFQILAFVFLIVFIVGAVLTNRDYLGILLAEAMPVVVLHNALAIALGFALAWVWRMNSRDTRAMAIEIDMHNSSIGLALLLNYFPSLGGAALVAAGWGIWHLISGATLAGLFLAFDRRRTASAPSL